MCTEYVSSGFLEDVEKNTCIFKDSCTIYVTNTLVSLTRKCMQFVVRMNSHVLMAYVLSSAPPRMTDSCRKMVDYYIQINREQFSRRLVEEDEGWRRSTNATSQESDFDLT